MQLTCPHCQFSKEIPTEKLPQGPTRVSCPRCKESFSLPTYAAEKTVPAPIDCPVCHPEQSKAAACSACGLIYAQHPSVNQLSAISTPVKSVGPLSEKPKAGFWLRVVALLMDESLVTSIQVALGFLLVIVGDLSVTSPNETTSLLLILFVHSISIAYYVIFTGQGGQTPGKMILRIQVVPVDGGRIGYGKAFYREIIGKFISRVTLCIGYLMAAFDDQKQTLHDRMAKTYVIKL